MRHLPMTTQQEREGVFAQDLTQGFIVIFISNILEKTTNTAQEEVMVKRTVTFMTRGNHSKRFSSCFRQNSVRKSFLQELLKLFRFHVLVVGSCALWLWQ